MSNEATIQNGYQKYRGMLHEYGQTYGGKIRSFFNRHDRRKNRRFLRQTFSNHPARRMQGGLTCERMAQYE